MNFSFDDHAFNTFLQKAGITRKSKYSEIRKIIAALLICWLPLAIITLIEGTFWQGSVANSFITHMDTQARFLLSMPLLILAERMVGPRLGKLLTHFVSSGLIRKEDQDTFYSLLGGYIKFLRSKITLIVILVLCYINVLGVQFYEVEYTSLLNWQIKQTETGISLNFGGIWNLLISRPLFQFILFHWLLRIIVWILFLRKVARFNLHLYVVHPDRTGGLGFLGYSIQFFAPVAMAFSIVVAANMADFILVEGSHVNELTFYIIGYMVFISFLFGIPLAPFIRTLILVKEKKVMQYYDYANGVYRELEEKMAKRFEEVTEVDIEHPYYSNVADMNSLVSNVLQMRVIPFTIKDFLQFWIVAFIPFIFVIALEILVAQIFDELLKVIL